jgi:N-ethylmaleimide reductase
MDSEASANRPVATDGKTNMLSSYRLGSLKLPNRFVMSPMTRARTTDPDRVPIPMEAEYYVQRATAGLNITGGTFISPQAIGGINIAGIYTEAQVDGWRKITDAVHKAGGRIFLQIVHSASVTHPSLLGGETPVAPSVVNPNQKIMTKDGLVDTVLPRALTVTEIHAIVEDFGKATANARKAGFDGVELHGGDIFLVPQFLNTVTNRRTDEYGGTPEKRARAVTEIITAMGKAWENGRIGVKLSPEISGAGGYSATDHVIAWLNDFKPAYLHLRRGFDANDKPIELMREHTFDHFRDLFKGTLIGNGGFDLTTANQYIERGDVDLVSFAKYYVANPDLVARFERNRSPAQPDRATYYTTGLKGYTDYPALSEKS